MIKILIIYFFIYFIKFISLFSLTIFLLINKQANDVLSEKKKICLKPSIMIIKPNEYPILKMIFCYIENKTFNLIYFKILTKKKNIFIEILKNYRFIDLIKIILLFYIGLSRFLLKIIKEVVLYNEKNLESYIFKLTLNPEDDRIITNIRGE
jgi:hypothetical protein